MGVSQSALLSGCDADPPASDADVRKRIRPYNQAANSRYIQLNSSYCALYGSMLSLVRNNKYADLLIICGDDRYPVHRAVVCPRSRFFEEHCAPREGERDYASPAKPTKIWIDPSECDSQTLAAVLTFLYTLDYSADGPQPLTFGLPEEVGTEEEDSGSMLDGDEAVQVPVYGAEEDASTISAIGIQSLASYTSGDSTPSGSSSRLSTYTAKSPIDPGDIQNQLVFHVQLCAAGQRFSIPSLCDVAMEKLNTRLSSGPWNVEIVACLREVYRNGSGGKLAKLREAVVKSARSRFRVLKTCKGWDDLVIDFPDFAVEMMRRL